MRLEGVKYLFITFLLLSNVMASKIVSLFGLIVPAAIIAYPVTFLFTDVVAEVEGKESARKLVMTGFYLSLVMAALLFAARLLPPAPFWPFQEAWDRILGATPRIVAASMLAYLVSQNHDVWSFHWWKRKTGGRHLWLRNNLSTAVSQLLDSILFITIAFWGSYPAGDIGKMILGQYAVKLVIALLDTPFCYMLVGYYGREARNDSQ